ncbi:hypothetical protein C8R47DRAFT_664809 [Mycena vitilis]|nr:hypothetical protein C8R47DRAFT_664809 [Mycena vitilis]
MLSSMLLSSSSPQLESLLLSSANPASLPNAGQLSYNAPLQPSNSPRVECDTGVPAMSSDLEVTYADLTSAQHITCPSAPLVGASPLGMVPRQEASVAGSKRFAARRSFSQGRCSSILQVLASAPSQSNAAAGVEIRPIDIFNQAGGVGLGLGLTAPLPLFAPKESVVVEAAPRPFLCSNPDAASPQSVSSGSSTPSPRSISSAASSPSPVCASPAPIPAPAAAVPTPSKYAGLSHGVPSHMAASGTRRRLASIPEEVECTPRGLPFDLCKDVKQPAAASTSRIPSPRTAATRKARLQSNLHEFFHTRKFAKRVSAAIPEARSREASVSSSTGAPQMSAVMLMAAQSVLEEDRKFRKKERMSDVPVAQSTVRLASQVLQVQEAQEKQRKQEKGAAPKKFLFLF